MGRFRVGGGGGGGGRGSRPTLKNHKNIGFSSNTGPDPLKNYKATKPAFNVVASWAHQRNGRKWPGKVVFGSFLPSSTKKNVKIFVKVGPPLTKLSGSVHGPDKHLYHCLYLYQVN